MKCFDVVVIGSSAGGLATALTGKSAYPEKSFLVVTKNEQTLVPCGIPYIFGSLPSSDKDIMPVKAKFDAAGIEMLVGQVSSIERENKVCCLSSGEKIGYDKLVIATGSNPVVPKWLSGATLPGVFTVPKDKNYLDALDEYLQKCDKIVVLGAGFIGLEISDELCKKGKDVTLVEKLDTVLPLAFDEDIANKVEELLVSRGVKVATGKTVKSIAKKDGKATGVVMEDGSVLDADAVILSIGYRPDVTLADSAKLGVNELGFISVDEYMRTSDKSIFAVGDCAAKHNFITRKSIGTMLASIAASEGRTAGLNLFGLSSLKTFNGAISIFSSALGEYGFGVAGLTEKFAKEEEIDFVVGSFEGLDKHPGTLPDTKKQYVKLVVARNSGLILGGAVYGGISSGEFTNVLGFIIQNKMTVYSLMISQIGTHPLLTDSPIGYPLVKAAATVISKLKKKRGI